MPEMLDYTMRIGSTPTFLYHCPRSNSKPNASFLKCSFVLERFCMVYIPRKNKENQLNRAVSYCIGYKYAKMPAMLTRANK